MNPTPGKSPDPRLLDALGAVDVSTRLQAVMAAGTHPHPDLVDALAEMPGTVAHDALRRLTHDDDRAVALTASALLGVLEHRTD
ncbi:hypothetical protein AB0G02_23460 [Actinosynnema sp. NPDC023658]|uniref:hypothetical protein n=1 Tax=Actinosynnema sp. NPDC023658 TaxID=3155465 RepID=UPI0033FB7820